MEKTLILALIVSSIFSYGCNNNEFALKEKCSTYISVAEKRNINDVVMRLRLKGVQYSTKLNSCISVYHELLFSDFSSMYVYFDELSGKRLTPEKGMTDQDYLKFLNLK